MFVLNFFFCDNFPNRILYIHFGFSDEKCFFFFEICIPIEKLYFDDEEKKLKNEIVRNEVKNVEEKKNIIFFLNQFVIDSHRLTFNNIATVTFRCIFRRLIGDKWFSKWVLISALPQLMGWFIAYLARWSWLLHRFFHIF